MHTIAAALLAALLSSDATTTPGNYFKITVVNDQTGRGVPLVELQTVNNIRCYTDSNGVVAFHEPGLMNQRVFFHVKSHGYEFAKDGFGFRGRALDVTEGGRAELKIKRLNIAERLYRVTGAGSYRDSLLTGQAVPIRRPLLNGLVFGSDSVVNSIYRGKIHWFWGDTNRPAYPLGNFNVPGATSDLPTKGGLDPNLGVNFDYFVDKNGFAKQTCPMPGQGPTWIVGLVALPDKAKGERLFASYVKVRGMLDIYARGLAEFNPEKQQFEQVVAFDMNAPLHPQGHPFLRDEKDGTYVYFANPYPLVRVRADPEDLVHLARYEAFTCLKEGSRLDKVQLDRAPDGSLRYRWKKNTPPLAPKDQAKLLESGHLKADEALLQLQDSVTGKPVQSGGGSVYWNEYRQRWVMVTVETFGTSMLGEIWFAEADTPLGPWVYARKIVTHDKYSFYNPKQHPMFDQQNGRVLFFEGTYTHTFSGNAEQTPRYDYNQIMYKLDLADSRLILPVPVYVLSDPNRPGRFGTARQRGKGEKDRPVAFFALDRPGQGSVPVYQSDNGLNVGASGSSKGGEMRPIFHALPANTSERPATTIPLYEFVSADGKKRAYSTDGEHSLAGYQRLKQPACLVWRNPIRAAIAWQ